MLQEIFLSPSAIGRSEAWTDWKNDIRKNNGKLRDVQHPDYQDFALTGSYKYSAPNMISPVPISFDVTGNQHRDFGPVAIDGLGARMAEEMFGYVQYQKSSSVKYPSGKVVFFLYDAVHDPRDADGFIKRWDEPGVTSTISLHDGSARSIKPYNEIPVDAADIGAQNADHFGPIYIFVSDRRPAHFICCAGGISGRDL